MGDFWGGTRNTISPWKIKKTKGEIFKKFSDRVKRFELERGIIKLTNAARSCINSVHVFCASQYLHVPSRSANVLFKIPQVAFFFGEVFV